MTRVHLNKAFRISVDGVPAVVYGPGWSDLPGDVAACVMLTDGLTGGSDGAFGGEVIEVAVRTGQPPPGSHRETKPAPALSTPEGLQPKRQRKVKG